ncbi:MAG: FAD-binding oxidoreductase [Gammaproteobacteria bacterium]|nr:FAD-binding oxidoreductase [Gammaproteobacteria bacterium]
MPSKIIIIGAGVVGAASALALQKDGHDVILVDREAPCAGASFGNAGAIVNGSCAPTAMPGIIFDAIRMLSKSNSPLTVHPAYFHRILPWLMRFILQSSSSNVNNNAKHLHGLSQYAVASWHQLTEQTELSSLFKQTGWLKVYETEKSFDGTKKSRQLLDKMKTPYEVLDASQIHDLEPNLAPIYKRGFFQKDSLSITNPDRLVKGMVELFVNRGGSYKQFAVNRINRNSNGIELIGSNETLVTDKVVIAAGAWSRSLAKQLGDNIPLDTERGYHLMLSESTSSLLSRPVVSGDDSFVLTPMETGMRMSAQIEFAGLDIAPDYSKIRKLLPEAKRMLPKIDIKEESVWMGFRPSLPDSLPALGFSPKSNNVLFAFGHQHLGMTLAAITGLTVADLVANRKPPIALSPYRPNRFLTL